jgi:hypothetical protein
MLLGEDDFDDGLPQPSGGGAMSQWAMGGNERVGVASSSLPVAPVPQSSSQADVAGGSQPTIPVHQWGLVVGQRVVAVVQLLVGCLPLHQGQEESLRHRPAASRGQGLHV